MTRSHTHSRVAAALEALSDEQLAQKVDRAQQLGAGIGGAVASLEVEGAPVFLKSVALTGLELPRTTANVFGLPLRFHYGLSSAGFGVWRELEAHLLTTGWALSGECERFPLLFHWRVLPRVPCVDDALERRVLAWGSAKEVRARLEAIRDATSRVVFFMERFPRNLKQQLASGPAPQWVERELLAVTTFLASRGFVHFDAHFENVLTDGQALYLSDFGQALSSGFELSAAESDFLAQHVDFDRSFVAMKLGSPRHAQVAAVMAAFVQRLRVDRTTAFPTAQLAQAWREV